MEIGVIVEELVPGQGDWRVCLSPNLVQPAGSISGTSYPSQEEASKAARLGNYD